MCLFKIFYRFVLLISFTSVVSILTLHPLFKTFSEFSIFNTCYAMGFGPSTLHSYLNEPLNLDIELVDAEIQSLDTITAKLASVEAFKKAEMPRHYFLSRLRFDVKRVGRRSFIHVTSADAIKQPYLDFLVELAWTGGHLVRGYTILLDPAPITDGRRNVSADNNIKLETISQKGSITSSTDKKSMEKLFGPEDKIQVPSAPPKIEQVTKAPAPTVGTMEQTQTMPETNTKPRSQPLSIAGAVSSDIAKNNKKDNLSKENITERKANGTIISETKTNATKANEAKTNGTKNTVAKPNGTKTKPNTVANTVANPQTATIVNPIAINNLEQKGISNWLFWLSAIALLCILSFTIWAANKYRLAKPKSKQRSDSEYFDAIGQDSIHKQTKTSKLFEKKPDRIEKVETAQKNGLELKENLKEELALKLVLANQYIDVGDKLAAKKLLDEILQKGGDQQKAEAENLILKLSSHD